MMIERYYGISPDIVQQLIAATKNKVNDRSGDNRFKSTKVFLFDEYAVLSMQNMDVRNVEVKDVDYKHLGRLCETLLDLHTQGVHVLPIRAFQSENGSGYMVQQRAKGAELYERDKLLDKHYILGHVALLSNAPQAYYDKFVADAIAIMEKGVLIDFVGKDNFFYHEEIGFQFIDLYAHNDYVYGLTDIKPNIKQLAARNCFIPCYFDAVPTHRDTVSNVLSELTECEWKLLKQQNATIFTKCKTALIKNGVAEKMIDKIISDDGFIPQKHQLGLDRNHS
ncbi:MAG: hypothetical protein ACOYI5_00060 [Christensenellales bacterium]|jgi:hypothetical protein